MQGNRVTRLRNGWGEVVPRWLVLLLALFVAKGIFLASIGPAWYGEDEVNHFGYIEALRRTGSWYSFGDNLASIELDVGRQLLDEPELSTALAQWWQTGNLVAYDDLTSVHQNATAYQPPLFYWLMVRVGWLFRSWHLVSQLYWFRYIHVFIGAAVVWVVYRLLNKVESLRQKETPVWLGVSLLALLPLFTLMAASVTVQVWVILIYAGLWYALWQLLATQWSWQWLLLVVGLMVVGLLSQQAFMAAPVWLGLVGVYAWWRKRWSVKQLMITVGLVSLGVTLVYPSYLQRHKQINYVVSREERVINDVSAWQYVPREFIRLKDEAVNGFWDMQRSFIPYSSSETSKRVATAVVGLALLGLAFSSVRLNKVAWKDLLGKKTDSDLEAWLVTGGTLLGLFLLGHGWFDFFQLRYGEQHYFKARYLYPLLPFLVWAIGKGWYQLWRDHRLAPMLFVSVVWLWLFMQGSAIVWLVIALKH